MHFRSIYEVKTSVLTIMFIHNDVQCNILTLLNSGTRVCVFLKNYTNVKFSLSNARTAKKTLKIAKIAPKRRFLHNYANYAGKEKKRDLCGKSAKTRLCARLCDRVFLRSLIINTMQCKIITLFISLKLMPFFY